ncbi:putative protein tyrosine phosphatase [Tieghemostelium lacteum]|uniref:Dual specificity protein phosphatase n=1 Tax=Tieghemostelium lacteum TaxID=361077 RepID=A0A152A1Y3_TIELA|nr:putative protein tyrosine phosphatase [Tieghemostelium lacteum]|eukprot:KYR00214.1 putative protein tyrosine phosphatase [Tieghemostelium lacteum]
MNNNNSLQDLINKRKEKMKNVDTIVTKENGQKYKLNIGTKDNDGKVNEQGEAIVDPKNIFGFVVDTKPDDKCYQVDLSGVTGAEGYKLYIGSQDAAFNESELTNHHIKSILNVGYGLGNAFPKDIAYCNTEILDDIDFKIRDRFQECFDFINLHQKQLKSGGTLVHCNAGVSRSSTILIAFLMNQFSLSLQESIQLVKNARPSIRPNYGFYKQLEDYEKEITKK